MAGLLRESHSNPGHVALVTVPQFSHLLSGDSAGAWPWGRQGRGWYSGVSGGSQKLRVRVTTQPCT